MIKDCESDSDFIMNLNELRILGKTQFQLTEFAGMSARKWKLGQGKERKMEDDKNYFIDVATKANSTYDNKRANDLIAAIKKSSKYATCKIGIIDNASDYSSLRLYFDETDQARQFKSIEEIFNEEYGSIDLSV